MWLSGGVFACQNTHVGSPVCGSSVNKGSTENMKELIPLFYLDSSAYKPCNHLLIWRRILRIDPLQLLKVDYHLTLLVYLSLVSLYLQHLTMQVRRDLVFVAQLFCLENCALKVLRENERLREVLFPLKMTFYISCKILSDFIFDYVPKMLLLVCA